MELARKHPGLVRIEPAASFFWPSWDNAGVKAIFSENLEVPEAFSFHLWQAQSWPYLENLDTHTVTTIDTTYNKIARKFVEVEKSPAEIREE